MIFRVSGSEMRSSAIEPVKMAAMAPREPKIRRSVFKEVVFMEGSHLEMGRISDKA